MNNLHDLMAKLAAIEEGAKFSEIPAAQRKEKYPHGWKVTQKDLDDEEHEDKISHPKSLAKATGKKTEDADVTENEIAYSEDSLDEQGVEECGDMPQGDEGEGKVTLSMSDLLSLINKLQGKGPEVGHGDEPLMGDEVNVGEEYANSEAGDPGEFTTGIDAVTATGDDMFSKGDEAPKVNGGGNPMEAALSELYAQVKARKLDELSTQTLSSYVKKRGAQLRGGSDDSDKIKGMNAALRKVKQNDANKSATLKEANQLARQLRNK